jgi:hypothetical protein
MLRDRRLRRGDRSRALVWLAASALLLGAGCSPHSGAHDAGATDSGRTGCTSLPIGDLTKPVELELTRPLDASGKITVTSSGATMHLYQPEQGGQVFNAGIRAKNLDGCNLQVRISVLSPRGELLSNPGEQVVQLVVTSTAGWGVPNDRGDPLNQLFFVAVCPGTLPGVNPLCGTYLLHADVEDISGRRAQLSVPIKMACEPGDHICACECSPDYGKGIDCMNYETMCH